MREKTNNDKVVFYSIFSSVVNLTGIKSSAEVKCQTAKDSMERLMIICTTIAQQPGAAHKQMTLALEAVKVRNQHRLDFSDPTLLCVNDKNPFYEACRAGNIPLVKLFISSGANLNAIDSNGLTALYYAMNGHQGSSKMVDFLLEAGSNPNTWSHSKCPLLASFYRMRIDTSIQLLKKGADVNNVILPSFCFVESVFALNSNLVMIACGVRFNLEEFDQLVFLSSHIIRAGLYPRMFYLYGRRFLREGFTPKEMSTLWSFQCLCMDVGFRVDQRSLKDAITDLQAVIPTITESKHLKSLQCHLDNMHVMCSIMANPLSLTCLCRISVRGHLAGIQTQPVTHLNQKIESLPVPQMCKDFLLLKSL